MDHERRPLIATYMMASRPFGVIYIGMTSNLYARAEQHRAGDADGFTAERGCNMLVWFQTFERVTSAIRREKALKSWNRPWKMQLIEQRNPNWVDLHPWLSGNARDPRIPLPDGGEGSVKAFLKRLDRGELGEG
ncbi:GIY-YIG nuclease family protein [Brevundimonas sp.]|uniref:GIY-YIG nuclease family protein n=1 Tax=Brevundimonas sp. TaxID=1871086 RepID=UPI001A31D465|nr:GIY-YIG nuclease family protein [Brevundimonas sp.]MBJ7486019.1 GIY-YIG nuclease family protein [Brevundimonas sp.]